MAGHKITKVSEQRHPITPVCRCASFPASPLRATARNTVTKECLSPAPLDYVGSLCKGLGRTRRQAEDYVQVDQAEGGNDCVYQTFDFEEPSGPAQLQFLLPDGDGATF